MRNNIKYYRKKKGYTLDYVAGKAGISIGYLCHLEKGNRDNPSYKIMEGIAKTLEVNFSDLFNI